MPDAVARRLGERAEDVGERAGDVGVDQHAHSQEDSLAPSQPSTASRGETSAAAPSARLGRPCPVTENIVAARGPADPYAMTSSRMATGPSSRMLLGASPLMIAYASSPVVRGPRTNVVLVGFWLEHLQPPSHAEPGDHGRS